MTGPCLCGDPYCSSCGNPSQAMFSDQIDMIADEIYNLRDIDAHFLELLSPMIRVLAAGYARSVKRGMDIGSEGADMITENTLYELSQYKEALSSLASACESGHNWDEEMHDSDLCQAMKDADELLGKTGNRKTRTDRA